MANQRQGPTGGPFGIRQGAVNVGELSVPFDIQQRNAASSIVDDQGGIDYEAEAGWTTVFANVWGRDYAQALSTVGEGSTLLTATRHRVTMRWRLGVEKGMRLKLRDGQFWYVATVINVNFNNEWLELTCTESAP